MSEYEAHDPEPVSGKRGEYRCKKCGRTCGRAVDPQHNTCPGITVPSLRELADKLVPDKAHQAYLFAEDLQTQLKGIQAKVGRLKAELKEAMMDEMVLNAVCSSAWRKYEALSRDND